MKRRITSLGDAASVAGATPLPPPLAATVDGLPRCCLPQRAACCRRAETLPLAVRVRAEPADATATLSPSAAAGMPGSAGPCGSAAGAADLPAVLLRAAAGDATGATAGCVDASRPAAAAAGPDALLLDAVLLLAAGLAAGAPGAGAAAASSSDSEGLLSSLGSSNPVASARYIFSSSSCSSTWGSHTMWTPQPSKIVTRKAGRIARAMDPPACSLVNEARSKRAV